MSTTAVLAIVIPVLVVLAALAYLARATVSALSQRAPSTDAAREPEPPPLGAARPSPTWS